jgi:hypothetical protein
MIHHTLAHECAALCSSLGTRSSACLPSPKASVVVRTAVAAAWTPARPGGRYLHILDCLAYDWLFGARTPTLRHMISRLAAACAVTHDDAVNRTGAWPARRPAARVAASRRCPSGISAVLTPWPATVGLHERSLPQGGVRILASKACGGADAGRVPAGLSPAHSRSFTSGLSEGRSVTPAQSAGFAG